jgi:hypothetical protein
MPKLDAFPSINNASLSLIGRRLATSIASICVIGSISHYSLGGCRLEMPMMRPSAGHKINCMLKQKMPWTAAITLNA